MLMYDSLKEKNNSELANFDPLDSFSAICIIQTSANSLGNGVNLVV